MTNEERYKEALELIQDIRETDYIPETLTAVCAGIAEGVLEGARAVLKESGTIVWEDVPEDVQARWDAERREENAGWEKAKE